jgi:hypothetical protein
MADTPRKIDVISSTLVYEGENKKGNAFEIYEIKARNPESGIEINDELKAFDNLPAGVGEYLIERRDDPEYGTSYTLKYPKGRRPAGSGPKSGLAERVSMLEQNVQLLRDRVFASDIPGGQAQPQQSSLPGESLGAPTTSGGGGGLPDDGSDMPFACSAI